MLHGITTFFKNIFSPPFCASCKLFLNDADVLCNECRQKIQPVVSHNLSITKTKTMPVLAIGAYRDPLIALIVAKSGSHRVASTQLGHLVWQLSNVSHLDFDYIVPIPLHWSRYAWRGYNQADEIARVISAKSGRPIAHVLRRVKRTPYLTYFSSEKRRTTMQDVFSFIGDKQIYKNKRLLLVDDVMTSGATLRNAARILYHAQPQSLVAVVVARVVHSD